MTIIEASRRAAAVVLQDGEMTRLHGVAVRSFGEGELNTMILEFAVKTLENEIFKEEILSEPDSLIGLLCGIWIQFLLREIAGVMPDTLEDIARKMFRESTETKFVIH